MKKHCHIHEEKDAHWHCHTCKMDFCHSCIIEKNIKKFNAPNEKKYLCPNCMNDSKWIALDNVVEKFWKRLPAFFSYPLSVFPLMIVLLSGAGSLFHLRPGYLPVAVNIILYVFTITYSFSVLKETSRGMLTPPPITMSGLISDVSILIKQYILYAALGILITGTIIILGPLAGAILIFGSFISFPAMIIILVTTESVGAALNPLALWQIISRIGKGYFLMFFFLFLIIGAPAALVKWEFARYLPKWGLYFLGGAAQAYYTIMAYNLMGYLILQYSKDIGSPIGPEDLVIEGKTGNDQDNGKEPDEEKNLLKRARFFASEKNYQKALEIISEYVKENDISSIKLSEYFFKLLDLFSSKENMIRYAVSHIKILLESEETEKAISIYEKCSKITDKFILPPDAMIKIGQTYYGKNRAKDAVSILSKTINSFPDSQDLPKAYFRLVQIMNDHFHDLEKTKSLIEIMKEKFPENELTIKAISYTCL